MTRPRKATALATLTLLLLLGVRAGALEPFATQVRPLLEKYCVECHGPKTNKADVDFSRLKAELDLERAPDLVLGVMKEVRAGTMPPAKSPQPTEAERRLLSDWFAQTMEAMDAKLPRQPGPAVLRRLNRGEYNGTIRDLTGLDLRLADDFPTDDTAHGFDNVSAALTLPPLLLENYLAAAEKVLQRVIVTAGPLTLLQQKIECRSLPGARITNQVADLALERELVTPLEIPAAGDYEVRLRAWQTGAGDEPATLVLKVDGVDSHVWNLSTEDRPTVLSAVVPLLKGTRKLSLRHTWHMELPKGQKPPEAHAFADYLFIEGPVQIAAHRRLFFVEPDVNLADREAARQVVSRFATSAFRRPVEAGELDRFLNLYDQGRKAGKSHIEAARLPLISVLVSPQFLFRVERDTAVADGRGACRLSDWELASRLSYFLWSTMPDAELFQLAAEKRLNDDQVLRQQVTRMLQDSKARALAENFTGQWLGVRKLDAFTPDAQLFPTFKPGLRQAMTAEPLEFFAAVMAGNRSVLEFLNSDWTIANEDLAKHYGLRGVLGGTLRRIALTNSVRGGVVTMAVVLTATSHPTRTSAVKRGKWVLEEILGAPPPPPPPNVPELEVPAKGQPPGTTLRARLERHRSDPRCFGCHVRMDTLGLGLENFDAIGRWREREGNLGIDASGTLPDGEKFAGPAELKALLTRHQDEFVRNLTEKLFVYALGRGIERSDRREVKLVVDALARDGWRFSTLVTETVMSYPFRHRPNPVATVSPTQRAK